MVFMQNLVKIGFIDSGIGGLNILNACKKEIKNAEFIYFGDNKNTPYGNKSYNFLKKRLDYMLKTLINLGANNIVIACNTLSVFLDEYCLDNYTQNFIFTRPILPKNYKNPTLVSTPITANSKFVKNLYKNKNVLPLPFLAKEIEDNIFNIERVNFKKDLLGLTVNTDSIVLGCTHYLFLKEEIKKHTNLPVISNEEEVSKNLKSVLLKQNLITENKNDLTENSKLIFIGENRSYNKKVFNVFFN